MNYETIIFEVQGHIAAITLNRPEQLNAWNATMMRELGRAMLGCDRDDEIRAVVVTGRRRAPISRLRRSFPVADPKTRVRGH